MIELLVDRTISSRWRGDKDTRTMPRIIITVAVRPALSSRWLLVRLIEKDDEQGYYLSCWSLPRPLDAWKQEQLEEYEAENWKCDVSTSEVEQWLEALRFQAILIAPGAVDYQVRDGESYEFTFENHTQKLQLSWHDEIPAGWQPIWSLTERLLEIARAQPGRNPLETT